MITMSKAEAEKKLNKKLTNREYCQYIHQLNFGNKKKTVKKVSVNNVLNDDKAEFLKTVKDKELNYYSKSYEYALKFGDNFLLFRKPDIETRFCFGHGQNGITTEEEQKAAFEMQNYADTNEKYFLSENLEGLNHKIEEMKILLMNNWEEKQNYCDSMYKKTKDWFYVNANRITKIYLCKNNNNTLFLYETENPDYDNRLKYQTVIKELEREEIEKILNIYVKQKENFEKRLHTYLKRYGLSKLRTWTYLVD